MMYVEVKTKTKTKMIMVETSKQNEIIESFHDCPISSDIKSGNLLTKKQW